MITKLKNNKLIIALVTACICFFSLFIFFFQPVTANAAEIIEQNNPGVFAVAGAKTSLNENVKDLEFEFNTNLYNGTFGAQKKGVYSIELYKLYDSALNDKKYIAINNVDLVSSTNYTKIANITVTKYSSYYTSKPYTGLGPYVSPNQEVIIDNNNKGIISSVTGRNSAGNVLTDKNDIYFNNDCVKLVVSINAESDTVGYFVKINYKELSQSFTTLSDALRILGIGVSNETTTKDYTATSGAYSRSYIIKQLNESGTLSEDESEVAESELDAIDNGVYKQIYVEYLEQIGESSFATKKGKYVTTLVYSTNKVDAAKLEASMNVNTLAMFGTPVNDIDYDAATNTYTLVYAKDVWLASKTVDGNTVNQFLDINQSYSDYYSKLKNDGVITNDLYEWFFAQVRKTDPALQSLTYNYNNVYGYWGYAVVPETFSLNSLVAELFDAGTQYKGVVKQYAYKELLTLSAYNKLLSDYQYPWLSRVWNDVAGAFEGYMANHVMVVCEPTASEAVISDNNSTDAENDNGFIRNGVENVIDDIGQFFGGTFGEAISASKSIIYGILLVIVAVAVIALITRKDKGK